MIVANFVLNFSVIVMKMSNLHRTSKERDEDEESDSSDEEQEEEEDAEKKPHMQCALIKHNGCVNRCGELLGNGFDFMYLMFLI